MARTDIRIRVGKIRLDDVEDLNVFYVGDGMFEIEDYDPETGQLSPRLVDADELARLQREKFFYPFPSQGVPMKVPEKFSYPIDNEYGYIFAQMTDPRWRDVFFSYSKGDSCIRCLRQVDGEYKEIEILALDIVQFVWLSEDGGIEILDKVVWSHAATDLYDTLSTELEAKRLSIASYSDLSVANLMLKITSLAPQIDAALND